MTPTVTVWGQRKKNVVDKNFKVYKPITPSLRHTRLVRNDELYKGRCHLPLTLPKRKTGGRNNTGKITSRHIGGGHKQRIRLVDFHRKLSGPQEVIRIEYDPGRSAHIALIKHLSTDTLSYILAPQDLRPGQIVQSFKYGIPRYLLDSSSPSILNEASTPTSTTSDDTRTSTRSESQSSRTDSEQESDGGTEEEKVEKRNVEEGNELIDPKELSSSALTLGLIRTLTIKPGNFLPIRLIPPGTTIHAISLKRDGKASLVRSAGTFAKLISIGHHLRQKPDRSNSNARRPKETRVNLDSIDELDTTPLANSTTEADSLGDYAQIKLQSGEIRLVHMDAGAAIGAVSNPHWQGRKLGKAGRARWLGRRPRVRGVAMNKVDHPLGGGRGKSKSNKQPVSPKGLKAKGLRTRRPGPRGNRMVVKQRPKGPHVGK